MMGYMDILYGIDNPLFMDLTDLKYVTRTILPWMLKYVWTLPKMSKLYQPVDEYLAGFSTNQALLDIIAQHFFQKTPAYFALSYFSLYLDYRYPRGGTGAFPQALERFILENRRRNSNWKPRLQALTLGRTKRPIPGAMFINTGN